MADETATLTPGTHITVRNVWHGRVFSAHPFTVIEETRELIATYIAPGTIWKHPTDLEGNDIRMPHGEWALRDDVWYGHGALRIFLRGAAHSVMVFLAAREVSSHPGKGGDVDRWYINLEEPFRKTPIGLDARDNHLDVVFPGDLSSHRWKDEHELDEHHRLGGVSAEEVEAIREEARRAIAWVHDGHPAVDNRWRGWSPPPEWSIPTLATGWETLALSPA